MNNVFIRYIVVVLIFIISQSFLGNTFFSYNKKIAKHVFEKNIAKYHYNATIKETDSTLDFSIKDPRVKPYNEILYFNNNGICYKQSEIYDCDSCLKKELTHFFENNRLHWVKISDEKYVANKKFILDIFSNDGKFFYILKKEKMNKEHYNQLIKENK